MKKAKTEVHIYLLFAVLACSSCGSPPLLRDQLNQLNDIPINLHTLEFDNQGRISRPLQVQRISEYLHQYMPKKIIIVSFGWQNNARDAELKYGTEFFLPYKDYLRRNNIQFADDPTSWAMIGVAWDSDLQGFSRVLDDILPTAGITEIIGRSLDVLAFPITFWAKATVADKIGFGGLRDALEEIIERAYPADNPPNLYLIGHSFGTRIVNGLVWKRKGTEDDGVDFKYLEKVKGAVYIQPAFSLTGIESTGRFPILVTHSRHDHANGFLFRFANTPAELFLPDPLAWGLTSRI